VTNAPTSTQSTPFHDLDDYIAIPRLGGLTLSPDGHRLIVGVSTIHADRTRSLTALWDVDPEGTRPPRRLTRSAKGEGGAAFLADGSMLFVSGRPDPDGDDDDPAALWLLETNGGEARVVATRPGGFGGVQVARDTSTVVLVSSTMPSAVTAADDAARRKDRKDRKVAAILHEEYPIRFWDHDLGPDQLRLFTGTVPPAACVAVVPPAAAKKADASAADGAPTDGSVATAPHVERMELRDLTPAPGRALDELEFDVSADGSRVATTWIVAEQGGKRQALAIIDLSSGERRLVLDDEEHEYGSPQFSPDGRSLAVSVMGRPTATQSPDVWLSILDIESGDLRTIAADWDRWPGAPRWTPDGSALIVVADSEGAAPIFRIATFDGSVTRLTGDHGAYTDVVVSPDGAWVYAMRSAVDAAPAPVRVDAVGRDQQPTFLLSPVPVPSLPGRLDEVTTVAADGTPLRAWLAVPDGASAESPAPLLLWIHGGPLGSWNAWSWRWNPWLAVAQGYAVVLPDPGLSTGYGQHMIQRGWGAWGAEPYTDLMTITDVTETRDDIDNTRVAAMGGSFGGYMANWLAGHTDRFAGIVTHASLWALDQFGPTTDALYQWRREMTPEMAAANSPHRFVDQIHTPMLVVHGDRDYRVPIGEALRLWAELSERSTATGEMPHKFLYFPDENHWVLTPQHAKVWYSTVFAFLDHTVHGKEWKTPDILR
jgi:dipeptidyl aminopeptidase/acylaminoacyl peptidase